MMADTYELIHYPTDGRFDDKQLVGTFPTREQAMDATGHSWQSAWQESGSAWILDDDVIDGLGRGFSPYLIQKTNARAVGQPVGGES